MDNIVLLNIAAYIFECKPQFRIYIPSENEMFFFLIISRTVILEYRSVLEVVSVGPSWTGALWDNGLAAVPLIETFFPSPRFSFFFFLTEELAGSCVHMQLVGKRWRRMARRRADA